MMTTQDRVRRAKLIANLDHFKYGPRILRALCVVALDLDKINAMTDAQLLSINGIGVKSLSGIRKNLAEYFNEESSNGDT